MASSFFDLFREMAQGPEIDKPKPDAISPLRSLRAYRGNALEYVGEAEMDAETSEAVFRIRRVFLDSNQRTQDIQTLIGSWDEREMLPWRMPV